VARLLVAEDDNSFRESLAEALRWDGYDVVAVDNGRDAVRAFSTQHFDLLLTDIKMPRLDGIGLLGEVLKQGGFLPCIVMTAYGTPDLERRAAFSGGLVFVNKPIDLPLLRKNIQELLAPENGASIVQGLTVASLVQLLGIERKTCRVKVHCGERSGFLFLVDGNLVGASLENAEGLNAALEILTWDRAEISILAGCPQSARSFQASLDSVLLKAMQIMDETGRTAGRPATSIDAAPSRTTHEEEKAMALEAFLDEFKGINGYLAAGIMDATGEMLASHTAQANVDLAAYGAVFNDIFRAGHEASRKIGLDSCTMMTLNTPKGIVIMDCTGVDAAAHLHVIVVLQENGNQALAKMTLSKLAPKVVAAMS